MSDSLFAVKRGEYVLSADDVRRSVVPRIRDAVLKYRKALKECRVDPPGRDQTEAEN